LYPKRPGKLPARRSSRAALFGYNPSLHRGFSG
jgi:hypothetical protein